MSYQDRPGVFLNVPVSSLDFTLRRTEDSFLATGNRLSTAMSVIRSLRQNLAVLEASLGGNTADRLNHEVENGLARFEAASDAFHEFMHQVGDLRLSAQSVKAEIFDLGQILQTLSIITVNARVHNGAIYPPQQRVTAFVAGLTTATIHVEQALSSISATAENIVSEVDVIDSELYRLGMDLRTLIYPALLQVREISRTISRNQARMSSQTSAISTRAYELDNAVKQVVQSLQIGDSTRQRLENIRSLLTGEFSSERVAFKVAELCAALSQGAVDDVLSETLTIKQALAQIREDAVADIEAAKALYMHSEDGSGATLRTLVGQSTTLTWAMGEVRDRLRRIIERGHKVEKELELIFAQSRAMGNTVHGVRIAALNALITSSKIGKQGRSLYELAQWLRSLTDSIDQITRVADEKLRAARKFIDITRSKPIQELIVELDEIMNWFERTVSSLVETQRSVADINNSFEGARFLLVNKVHEAFILVDDYRASLVKLEGLGEALQPLALAARCLDENFGQSAEVVEHMAEVRTRYRMSAERRIHDEVIASSASEEQPVAEATEDAAADSVAQEVDDIFF